MSQEDLDIAVIAERETEAQLAVIRALKPLDRAARIRVLRAAGYLIEADICVPGVLALVALALRSPEAKGGAS
jgi:hypothetical protein